MSNALRNTLIVLLVLSIIANIGLFFLVGIVQIQLEDTNMLVVEWCEYSNDVADYSNGLLDSLYYYDSYGYGNINYIEDIDCFN